MFQKNLVSRGQPVVKLRIRIVSFFSEDNSSSIPTNDKGNKDENNTNSSSKCSIEDG